MTIFINDTLEIIKMVSPTVATIIEEKNINPKGTAVALNGKLVARGKWECTEINDNDRLTIISAAYGG